MATTVIFLRTSNVSIVIIYYGQYEQYVLRGGWNL